MANRIKAWLEATACRVLDPERDERVGRLARDVAKCMRREGSFFDFTDTTRLLRVGLDDLPLVQERVYELTLKHVMRDYVITPRDRTGLGWIARRLRLPPEVARQVEVRVGRRVFEEYLAFALGGGYLDEEELGQLRSIADSLNVTTRQLLIGYLADAGEEFLRRIVEGIAENGRIDDTAWRRLIDSTERLGLREDEFVRVLRAQAHRHMLVASHRTAGSQGEGPAVGEAEQTGPHPLQPLLERLATYGPPPDPAPLSE